jgi:hypothetical protein
LAHVTYRPLIEGDSFSFTCIDKVCVAAALGNITSNATGLDGIPLVFIKLLLLLILPVLTNLLRSLAILWVSVGHVGQCGSWSLIVGHGLFILMLRQSYGFHATAAALVSSNLFLRYQKVACGDDVSLLAPLVAGVSQGSPIPSLCFSLFIDEVLDFLKYHMYVDNLQIYHTRTREILFEFIREVKSDLSKVFEWSLVNSFKLNPSKSMVLPIYRNHLFQRFFLVAILSRMFLRQRT